MKYYLGLIGDRMLRLVEAENIEDAKQTLSDWVKANYKAPKSSEIIPTISRQLEEVEKIPKK